VSDSSSVEIFKIHELNPKIVLLGFFFCRRGRLTCGAAPISDATSKLYMPKYLYSDKTYPGYLSGTAYVMRSDIIPTLLQNSLTTPLLHLEDIYVTGLLARQSQIYPDDSAFFTYNHLLPKDNCAFRFMVRWSQPSKRRATCHVFK
jgi:hypothetical protein